MGERASVAPQSLAAAPDGPCAGGPPARAAPAAQAAPTAPAVQADQAARQAVTIAVSSSPPPAPSRRHRPSQHAEVYDAVERLRPGQWLAVPGSEHLEQRARERRIGAMRCWLRKRGYHELVRVYSAADGRIIAVQREPAHPPPAWGVRGTRGLGGKAGASGAMGASGPAGDGGLGGVGAVGVAR